MDARRVVVPCPHCGYPRPCLGATDGRCIGGQADLRRMFLGEFKSEPTRPAPWSVSRCTNQGFVRPRVVFLVTDARRECVAEFEDGETAREVVELWNVAHKP